MSDELPHLTMSVLSDLNKPSPLGVQEALP
jgi:hypothetical protein